MHDSRSEIIGCKIMPLQTLDAKKVSLLSQVQWYNISDEKPCKDGTQHHK
jgi:hypothetical protein